MMLTRERTTSSTLTLAIHATDIITGTGVEAYFRSRDGVELLGPGDESDAEVLLILAGEVTEGVLDRMREAGERSDARIVLVANYLEDWQLARALDHGLACFLIRSTTKLPELFEAVRASRSGRTELPGSYVRSLIDRMRTPPRDGVPTRGFSSAPTEFSPREIDVLRLLAEGLDTAEVATRLNYSERTIKNVIAGMMHRLGLRNRSHAIAHAIKTGAL
ncbi:LuxR C-terminal-related transcriptional regulator [Streptomyces sp. NPDC048297]|uniref:helix-turn-helix transcriptional regulator n=1 Tax=Streptomyces sp. NPDC048297 TaxID=3365531 RepID=UPI003723F5A5